jgi:transcriptional regulator with XRE-family HTH domain
VTISPGSAAFGALLHRLRTERGLSMTRLAERSDVSRSHVIHVERGRGVSREVAAALAAGLGLGGVDTARLLIAAGFWPWRMPDAAVTAFVEAVEQASEVGGCSR